MILIDTHVLLWWGFRDDAHYSKAARLAVEQEEKHGQIAISCISAWEIAMLVDRGRLSVGTDLGYWLSTIEKIPNVRFVPLDNSIAVESESLPGEFHRDPADRMIVATARKLGVPLVTMDERIRKYSHVRTIW